MRPNNYWKGFVLFFLLASFTYSLFFAVAVYRYQKLSAQTKAKSIEWNVKALSPDRFQAAATYRFMADDLEYSGEFLFEKPVFLNRFAADLAIAKHQKEISDVWYALEDPAYSSLQKKFPIKECLSSVLLWAIALYFVILAFYVNKASKA